MADHISALSAEGAKAAARQMAGALSRKTTAMQDALADIIAEMEAGIEYPEEDLEDQISGEALPKVQMLTEQIADLVSGFRQGKLVREG